MPSELRQRLLEPGVYRVQSRKRGGGCWYEAAIDRDDYVETVICAALLRQMSPTLELEIEHVGDKWTTGTSLKKALAIMTTACSRPRRRSYSDGGQAATRIADLGEEKLHRGLVSPAF